VNDRDRLAASVEIPSVASYLDAARKLRAGAYDLGPLRPLRVAILRSFTVEPLIPYLMVECALVGVALEVYLGDFGTYRQEILDAGSPLYDFEPDAVLLAVDGRELVPALVGDFLLRSTDEIGEAQAGALADLRSLAKAFRSRSSATLIVQTLVPPGRSPAGMADRRLRPGQREAFQALNRDIVRIADEIVGIEVFDLEAHAAMVGQSRWEDARFALLARAPIAADQLPGLARAYARMLALVANVRRKCVVVDLDDTLWGGVVGEDGWEGIRIGHDYPGSAFVAFQRGLLDLQQRGIVLAIASKNEPNDVKAAFERTEMLLRPDHFAAQRIGWQDKATSIREIADELGLGLDALVFIDDAQAERELVRQLLPDVLVPDWPTEPARFVDALHAIAGLDSLRITAEDRARGAFYRAETARAEARAASSSLEDFYRSLRMTATIERARPSSFARIAQLTQKTNQFNVTLRRYSEAEISSLASSTTHEVCVFTLRDRFGDSGQVAVAIVGYEGAVARIDALLMSCRVLGRGLETFILSHLADTARARGATRLEGCFVEGPRNGQVAKLYPRHGFRADEAATARWYLALADDTIEAPDWISEVARRELTAAS
jgi:FkbH-like protein